jgi:hypothetical protein
MRAVPIVIGQQQSAKPQVDRRPLLRENPSVRGLLDPVVQKAEAWISRGEQLLVSRVQRCHAEAEAVVRTVLPDRHLIVRTGRVYGPEERGRNRGCRLARSLAAGKPMDVATDRHGQPTYGPDLAEVAVELARLGQTGTVHVVGPDRHTEFTFARLAAHVFGRDVDLIRGVPAAEFADDPRPSRVWLDRFKLRTVLGPRAVRGAAEGLRALRAVLHPVTVRHVRAA